MSDFKAFMADSALPIEAETVGYIASKRFPGENGEPVEWRLRDYDGTGGKASSVGEKAPSDSWDAGDENGNRL